MFAIAEYTCADGVTIEQAMDLVVTRHNHVQDMRDILQNQEMAEQDKTGLEIRLTEIYLRHIERNPEWVPGVDNIDWSI
jgi:hypothetical protein